MVVVHVAPEVELSIHDTVGWIEFNRPSVSNAVRPETMRQLCLAIDECVANEVVRAIVIGGKGKHFAAGADYGFLEALLTAKVEDTRDALYTWFVGATRRLWRCPKPTIAAVNGYAVTVGCEVALACDLRVASNTAVFHESWLGLGLLPPLGGSVLLPKLIGLGRAAEMILGAKPMNAAEALASGLVAEVVSVDELRGSAQRRALELAESSAQSYRLAKEALHRPFDADMEREWQANVLGQALLINSERFKERVKEVRERTRRK